MATETEIRAELATIETELAEIALLPKSGTVGRQSLDLSDAAQKLRDRKAELLAQLEMQLRACGQIRGNSRRRFV